MDIYGHLLICMDVYEHLWMFINIHGRLWLFMDLYMDTGAPENIREGAGRAPDPEGACRPRGPRGAPGGIPGGNQIEQMFMFKSP